MKSWYALLIQTICIVNTLLGDEFSKFVHEAMAKRERMLIHKKRMEVDALPEFKELIRKSLHVSCTR